MSKVIAIHQPNCFPWFGYFDKLVRADVFVVLDHVQFPKKKGNWGNRVQFLIAGDARFVTMPVSRDYHGFRNFNEMRTNPALPWRDDLIKTLRTNYGRTAHFAEVFTVVEPLINDPVDNLASYNLSAITTLAARLRIDTGKIVLSSTLGIETQATDMLIDVVRAVGGDTYLSGDGASGYQEPEKFAAASVALTMQTFQHPTYPQVGGGAFVPGLSLLDALFNCGFDTVAAWLHATPASNRIAA